MERLRAYYLAYVIFNATVFLFLVGASLFMDIAKINEVSYVQISVVLWGVFLYGWTLPSAVIAWTDRGHGDDE